jgi:hypothetical protein
MYACMCSLSFLFRCISSGVPAFMKNSRRPRPRALPALTASLILIGASACALNANRAARPSRQADTQRAPHGTIPHATEPSTTTVTTTPPKTATTPPPRTTAVTTPAPAPPWATKGESELFVSPVGSDSNPGTREHPLRQIQMAADRAVPGTVVHLASGDYHPVINRTAGSRGRPITFLADVWGGARISQTGVEPAWLNMSDHVDIVGVDLSAPRSRTGINNRGSYVRIFNSRIHDVFTTGSCTGGAGINHELYSGTGNAAIGNTVHAVGVPGCSLTHGIYVSNADFQVQNNLVYDVSGWLLHFYHATNRGTVSNNTLFAGVSDRGARSQGGITLCADEGNTVPADNFVVTNNIIRDVPVGLAECGKMNLNIGPHNRYENNLIHNAAIPASLQNPINGLVASDPRFVNWKADGTGDYRLSKNSPALDSGVAAGAPAYDKILASRPNGTVTDRGAYEGAF